MAKTLSTAILVAAAISGASFVQANPARAVVVTVEGGDWEISSFTGSPFIFGLGLDPRFAAPPAPGGEMPWWGNSALAASFAEAVRATPGSDARLFGFSESGGGSLACIGTSPSG